ncbi:DUF1214 domain-containing protein [Paraburkholderia rhynchosiae]|uniref:DUF1214 domain-containing protein n=1 Tax=Paraburkholderia rhynchosiae TaxID=487049 RepID=A0A2N7VX89_9BURK|nr:DUF1214 domain-containing protein [Paraburkholderia rhynchosiae]PMS21776.1 hypothetical protein C0Z16_33455 [Paraburkholderia rhynchosiae]CAB3739182.1 hypothetical protein LMG27174_06532 [Paraburkholderia rhynchosiae]
MARLKSWKDYVARLADAEKLLELTETPDDPQTRADLYRQFQMNMSLAYFIYFQSDPHHPDWLPFLNSVFMLQPNPDDTYFIAPLRGDLRYRLTGERGSVHLLTLDIGRGIMGTTDEVHPPLGQFNLDDLEIGSDGRLELLLSAQRPEGYEGNWLPLHRDADFAMLRQRSYAWGVERDARIAIECLDAPLIKPLMGHEEIALRTHQLMGYAERLSRRWLLHMQQLRVRMKTNEFEFFAFGGGLAKQAYWQAIFDFGVDEALILETDLPQERCYWNVQLNDALFNALDYVDHQSSLNGHQAHVDEDGRFRAVISHRDPGVPNWLDTCGRNRGTAIGRWYACSSEPVPTLKRVPLADVRNHLPAQTPFVNEVERTKRLRERHIGAQLRRRW